MTRIYTGTANVTNGSKTVTINTGSALSEANCPADASITLAGLGYFVGSRTDTTHFELTRNYAGATATGVIIEIDPMTPKALSLTEVALSISNYNAALAILDANTQGLFYHYVDGVAATDPGVGNVAFNNADLSLATEMYIDNFDANNRPVTGLMDTWAAGTSLIVRVIGETSYAAYSLNNPVTDSTGFRTAASMVYIGGDGLISPGAAVSIAWFGVGEGLKIDAIGTFAGRATYNASATGFNYLSTNGNGSQPDTATIYRKNSATSGDWSAGAILQGPAGATGWAPLFGVVADGSSRDVLRLIDYVGGTGAKPTGDINKYVSPIGYTAVIADATNVKGSVGVTGASAYAIAVSLGFSGDEAAWIASLEGEPGTDGIDGTDPGALYIFGNGLTDVDPGAGVIQADNATLTSATTLYVSKTNRAGNDLATFLAGLTASTSTGRKGIIYLNREGGNAQTIFDLVSLTDATNYVKLTVANGSGATGFIDNDTISFQFSPAGAKGTDGAGAGNMVNTGTSVATNFPQYSDTSGVALEDSGIGATDVVLKVNNGSDFLSKQTAFDNFSINGADIASAATVNLETATGSFVAVTGTVTTTAITLADGHRRRVYAVAAWPITQSTNLQVNAGIANGQTYVCAAGDLIDWYADGSVIRGTITKANGRAVVPPANFSGDTGAGGAVGQVPAPAAGDAASGKVLGAGGAWVSVNSKTAVLAAIGASKATTARLFIPNGCADGFAAPDSVDAASTNYLQDTAIGRIYPTTATPAQISQATGTVIGDMTFNGGLAAAFDSVTNQAYASSAVETNSGFDGAAFTGKNYSAAPKKIARADVYATNDFGFDSTPSASTITLNLRGKNGSTPSSRTDGTLLGTWSAVDAVSTVASITSSDQTTAWDYVWIEFIDSLTARMACAEIRFFAAGVPNNMTVIIPAFTVDIVPATIAATLVIRPFDPLTLNTDLTLEVSRNGGTNWTAATLTQVNTLGPDRLLTTPDVSVSGQPSGSSVSVRIKSLNNKLVEFRGLTIEAK